MRLSRPLLVKEPLALLSGSLLLGCWNCARMIWYSRSAYLERAQGVNGRLVGRPAALTTSGPGSQAQNQQAQLLSSREHLTSL